MCVLCMVCTRGTSCIQMGHTTAAKVKNSTDHLKSFTTLFRTATHTATRTATRTATHPATHTATHTATYIDHLNPFTTLLYTATHTATHTAKYRDHLNTCTTLFRSVSRARTIYPSLSRPLYSLAPSQTTSHTNTLSFSQLTRWLTLNSVPREHSLSLPNSRCHAHAMAGACCPPPHPLAHTHTHTCEHQPTRQGRDPTWA